MCVFERCVDICRGKPGVVVFSDGEDKRSVVAAARLVRNDLAEPVLMGRPLAVRSLLQQTGETGTAIRVIDPLTPSLLERNVADYMSMQKAKGKDISGDDAAKTMRNPLAAGAIMIRRGEAEVGVAGNLSSTADVIRAGLRVLGTAPGTKTVSSFFFMISPKNDKLFMFTDAGVIPDPTPSQLADIAFATSRLLKNLMGEEPRVALLSFSTKGSAEHPRVDKMREALAEIKKRDPNLLVDGELQVDAAIVPEVARLKAPGSPLEGKANIFVFPSLEAGNIAYKVAQRFGGYTAFGPLLQGFAGGWHDLSRGCTSDDMYKMAVVGMGMERGGK